VVVAEEIGEAVEVLGVTTHGRAARGCEQAFVIPEVLHPLAPSVEILHLARAARG